MKSLENKYQDLKSHGMLDKTDINHNNELYYNEDDPIHENDVCKFLKEITSMSIRGLAGDVSDRKLLKFAVYILDSHIGDEIKDE